MTVITWGANVKIYTRKKWYCFYAGDYEKYNMEMIDQITAENNYDLT